MKNIRVVIAIALATVACVPSQEAPEELSSPDTDAPVATVRVSMEQFRDATEALPENVSAIDLGELTVSPETDFCEAASAAPGRWANDALFPVQYWLDLFTSGQSTAPNQIQPDLDLLINHATALMGWNFRQVQERPKWGAAKAEAMARVYETAARTCPNFPVVLGREPNPDGRSWWTDIEAACNAERDFIRDGIEWYIQEFGAVPVHQDQIEHRTTLLGIWTEMRTATSRSRTCSSLRTSSA